MHALLSCCIKALRTAKNLTREQVANSIGTNRQKRAGLRRGTNNVSLNVLTRIAPDFGVTVNDISNMLDEAPTKT